MLNPTEITGVVLAGGKSSRFGSNKAMSQFNGKSFLQNSVETLMPFSNEVVISGKYPEYDDLKNKILKDEISDIGPVGGIYTALKYCSTPKILVLTCDMPLITSEVIRLMLDENLNSDLIGWSQDGSGGQFPLLISKTILPFIEKNIEERKLRVKQLFDWENSLQLTIPDRLKACFVNINTIREYNIINA